MFGKKVFSVTSPNASPKKGLANSEGIIISDKNHQLFGSFWIVIWTDGESAGSLDSIPKHSLKKPGVDSGAGVYLVEGSEAQ